MKSAVLVHGGCGHIKPDEERPRQQGLDEAAAAAKQILESGGSALDAVESAVMVMEDHPLFNAGTGSALTFDGAAETDASVMLDDRRCGAVASVRGVRHSVHLARLVMERTDHVMLVGDGAIRFAQLMGLPTDYDCVTGARRARWDEIRRLLRENHRAALELSELELWQTMESYFELYLDQYEKQKHGTVGAVAIDRSGHTAAATSTGGIWFKLQGRVGDTPLIGAGTWATREGAVSATGHGEGIIRFGLSRTAVDRMPGRGASKAVTEVVEEARRDGVEVGLIGVDPEGGLGWAFNSEQMGVASWSES